jgi:hypothetical protein
VVADRVQLLQVLMNLMLKSIQAMKDVDRNRELTIKSQPVKDGQLQISISDTGVGIPTDQTDQIFAPFFSTSLRGRAWDWPSPVRLWTHIVAVYGPPRMAVPAQPSISLCQPIN